jgi:methionyl-tRNA synthetase
VNGYLDRAPWFGVIEEDRQAAATTVYTALRAIDSLKILFAPFLPFSSEQLHESLGYTEPIFGEQKIATYEEAERSHEALIYDASSAKGRWAPSDLEPGRRFRKPKPMYRKLDDSVIDEERERLGQPSE